MFIAIANGNGTSAQMSSAGGLAAAAEWQRQMDRRRSNGFARVHHQRWFHDRLRVAHARRLPEPGRVARRGKRLYRNITT